MRRGKTGLSAWSNRVGVKPGRGGPEQGNGTRRWCLWCCTCRHLIPLARQFQPAWAASLLQWKWGMVLSPLGINQDGKIRTGQSLPRELLHAFNAWHRRPGRTGMVLGRQLGAWRTAILAPAGQEKGESLAETGVLHSVPSAPHIRVAGGMVLSR